MLLLLSSSCCKRSLIAWSGISSLDFAANMGLMCFTHYTISWVFIWSASFHFADGRTKTIFHSHKYSIVIWGNALQWISNENENININKNEKRWKTYIINMWVESMYFSMCVCVAFLLCSNKHVLVLNSYLRSMHLNRSMWPHTEEKKRMQIIWFSAAFSLQKLEKKLWLE